MLDLARPWSPVEVRRDIAAPPDVVFDLLANPRTYPDWLVGNQKIRSVDPEFPKPGSRFDHSVGATDEASIDDQSEVLSSDPPNRLELLVKAGPMRGVVTFLLLPSREGTEVRFQERPVGWMAPLTPFLRPILHGRNVESLRELAQLVEDTDGPRQEEGS
jgi:uncharacterized protein YndB with AHSA1/START domain